MVDHAPASIFHGVPELPMDPQQGLVERFNALTLAVTCAKPGEDPGTTRTRARAFLEYLREE